MAAKIIMRAPRVHVCSRIPLPYLLLRITHFCKAGKANFLARPGRVRYTAPMMDWSELAVMVGWWVGWAAVVLLCLGGLTLSAVTLSGTWLVVAATALAAWLGGPAFPGWLTVTLFVLLSLGVEFVEWMASLWGVQRRGGSAAAGWAAMGGGLLGLILGSPLSLFGGLIGMVVGSFVAAYAVEKRRLQAHQPALHIALGTVLARLFVLFLKTSATLGMVAVLGLGLLFTHH